MMPPSCQRDPLVVADPARGEAALPVAPVLREYLLKVSFIAARVRLLNLISGGSLVPTSIDAYSYGLPVLAHGVPGDDLSVAAHITVRIAEPTDTAGVVILPLRWHARGTGGQLVRVLDAELMLVAAMAGRTLLRLEGEFRLPVAGSGAGLGDGELPRRAATASMNYLLDHIRESLAAP
ncbi:MAG TPA: hypothetical protein VIZ00_02835 [Streptosporangiaceae bacterium]